MSKNKILILTIGLIAALNLTGAFGLSPRTSAANPVLTGVSIIDPTADTMSPGSIEAGVPTQLIAEALDETGALFNGAALNWLSSNEAVATIDSNGVVTGLASGTAVFTVTAINGTISVSGTLNLSVYVVPEFPAALTTIDITPLNPNVAAGATKRFSAVVSVVNPGQPPIILPMASVNWSSDNGNIGTIDSATGLFTALTSGQLVITAASGNASATTSISVFNPVGSPILTGVLINNPNYNSVNPDKLVAGTEARFTAGAVDQFDIPFAGATLNWSSSDISVATVDDSGLVNAIYPGNFILAAQASYGNITVEATIELAVIAPPVSDNVVASIIISKTSLDLVAKQGWGVSAQAYDRYGALIQNLPGSPSPVILNWTTSSATIATVTPYPNDISTAFIKAIGPGAATITVSANGVSDTMAVTVSAEPSKLASIGFSPASADIYVGDSQQFTITAFDQYGAAMNPAPLINLINDTPAVAALNANNLATGLMPGQTTITAYGGGGVSASAALTVRPAPNTFGIIAAAGANGSVSPSGYLGAAAGASQSYIITPNANYHIANVLVDGTSIGTTTNYTFVNIQTGHTLNANFAANTVNITASASANGSVSPAGTRTVPAGNSLTYIITPASGYSVSDVLVDNVSVGAVTSYSFANLQADHSLSASFIKTPVVLNNLVSGWNLIGWTNLQTTAEAFSAANINVDLISKWDAANQLWVSHITNFPLNNFTINPGDGIFVHKN